MQKILAIETSCDETSVAVIQGTEVLSNIVASQAKLHSEYGGVVPEVAARAHIENIIPVIDEAFSVAFRKNSGHGCWNNIDYIAVTEGLGLLPSLLMGVATAKALAFATGKPLIPVDHITGHIYANWIGKKDEIKFPALALVVSGGHTELQLMRSHMRFERIGGTLDDAAGEAFDKVANLLELGYPGGPVVSKKAEDGKPDAFDFPRALIKKDNFDFSFSGLKTSVIYTVKKLGKLSSSDVNNICASFEQAVVDVLVEKTLCAIEKFKVKSVLLAGGVAANKKLRKTLQENISKKFPQIFYHQPNVKHCLDNAAMIGSAAFFKIKIGCKITSLEKVEVKI
ncbi:MAG: hypothetical protein ACD_63C00256G0003 [uncultured bacterium]|nr:MAG: hypothetical protein ACD_63C00256G0003 [uncultured bacterium]